MSRWTYQAVDPSTGARGPELALTSDAEVEARVDRAWRAWRDDWSRRPLPVRGEVLRSAARLLRERADALAGLMAAEMGKPLADGRAEAEKCAWVCEHAAEHAAAWLAPEPRPSDGRDSYVRYDPLGVVLAIMPWNFPLWQLFRFAAPSMMAGNTFALKHAPGTPGCGEEIERIFTDAGAPECPNLRLGPEQVERLIGDPRIAAVTLTGSTQAGRSVASIAARHLKRTVLELGGSDPLLVLDDADLELAVETAAKSRLLNTGQSCISAKRFVVTRGIADRFVPAFRERLAAARVGDPRDPATTLGPMARADLRDGLHDQVRRAIAAGARCVLGGELPDGPGFFYPPTLLVDVGPGNPAWTEELFGPVAALRVVADEDAAVEAANEGTYGLGAAIFTADTARAERLAPRLQAGCVFVNGLVKSDPRLPFGGVRDSGWGKELGPHGMRELTNARTVWIR